MVQHAVVQVALGQHHRALAQLGPQRGDLLPGRLDVRPRGLLQLRLLVQDLVRQGLVLLLAGPEHHGGVGHHEDRDDRGGLDHIAFNPHPTAPLSYR